MYTARCETRPLYKILLITTSDQFDNLPRLLYIVIGPLAQLAEQLTLTQSVVGSSPTGPTTMTPVCHRCFLIQRVALSRFVLTWERGSLVNDMLGEENATTSQISAVTGIIAAKHYHGDTNRIAIHPFITAQRGLILIY